MSIQNKIGKLFTKQLSLNNGRYIPQIGLGCENIQSQNAVESAIYAGYQHFYTAGIYQNEKWIGHEIYDYIFMKGYSRLDYYVCSKIPPAFQEYNKAKQIIDQQNKSVDLGYLDCVLLDWPVNFSKNIDDKNPINIRNRHDCWKALEDKIDENQIAGAGVSNFQVRHLEQLLKVSKYKPVLNQIETNPLQYDDDTIKFCRENDILIEAYSPFAQENKNLLNNQTLNHIAQKNEIDVYQLILVWCIQKGFVILPCSSSEEQQIRNIMLDGLFISDEDIKEIDWLKIKNQDFAFKQSWDPINLL